MKYRAISLGLVVVGLLTMVSGVARAALVLQEDFEDNNGTTLQGHDAAWVKEAPEDIKIWHDVVVDSGGHGHHYASLGWAQYRKVGTAQTIGAGEHFELTGTLWAHPTLGNEPLMIVAAYDSSSSGLSQFGFYVKESNQTLSTYAYDDGAGEDVWGIAKPGGIGKHVDAKTDIYATETKFYIRNHGDTGWGSPFATSPYGATTLDGVLIAGTDESTIHYGFQFDSILLQTVPEPATLAVLAIGGLLSLLKRRRA